MVEYLTRESPEAFVDYPPLKENEYGAAAHKMPAGSVQCPKCQGHGGWNLRMNAYGLPAGYTDTAEHRHHFSHSRASCNQCDGWGYVTEEDARCIHEWDRGKNVGRCLTLYTCTKCGKTRTVDSSD